MKCLQGRNWENNFWGISLIKKILLHATVFFCVYYANYIEINYISHSDLGGGGKFITAYEISKAADSQFIPGYAGGEDGDYSVLGNFMVGEIKAIGEYDRKTGELNYFDGGISYAVMPESYIGIHDATGMSGYQEMLSFPYAFEILFYATSKGGYFTDEEKQEVLKVLSTFKAVE